MPQHRLSILVYKISSMATVQTSKMMEPVSIVLLWGTTQHV